MSLERLNECGVCCSLFVSYPKYRDNLDLALFNMTAEGDNKSILKAPALNLMVDALRRIGTSESRGRKALQAHTLSLDMQVGLRFCPINGLAKLLETVDEAKAEFDEAADEFIDNFDEHLQAARDRWREVVDMQTELTEDVREQLLIHGYDQLQINPPPRSRFVMSMLTVELSVPGQASLVNVDAAEVGAAQEAADRVRRETSERMTSLSDTFVDSCREELRERMTAFFTDMNRVIRAGKPINKRTMSRVLEFIDTTKRLNFMDDASFTTMLGRFETVCFPDGIPDSGDEVDGVRDEDTVNSVSASVADIVSLLAFDVRHGHDDGSNMDELRDEVSAPAAEESGKQLDLDDCLIIL